MDHQYYKSAMALATSDKTQTLSLDTETSSKDPRKANVCGFSFSDGRQSFYIPIDHYTGNVEKAMWDAILSSVLTHPLVGHNTSYDEQVLARLGYPCQYAEDTMIMAYAIGDYPYIGLKFLSDKVLRYKMTELESLFGKKPINVPSLPPEVVKAYAEGDAMQTYRLYEVFQSKLTPRTNKIYNLERQLVPTTKAMEEYGVPVNREFMIAEGNRLLASLVDVRKAFYLTIAETFDITYYEAVKRYPDNSTEAMKTLLYAPHPQGLGLVPMKQTKTGANSTDESSLKSYRDDHPIVNALLSIREIQLRGKKYLSLADMVEPDGAIHAHMNQFGATSGRYGSSNPNVQNWSQPGHWEVYYPGHETIIVDEAFRNSTQVPDDEWLLELDYSQIEYRVIAGYCKCRHLLDLYAEGRDMHKATYAFCFNIPYEAVTKKQRSIGKTINFALSFGMGVAHFYRELQGQFTMEETARIHKRYFSMLPEVVATQDATRKHTDKTHSVDTYFGRHQHIPEYDSIYRQDLSKAQRAGFARIIQGTAADILKIASVRVTNMINAKYAGQVKYFLSIHDSMLFRGSKSVDIHQFIADVRAVAEIELPGYPKFRMSAAAGQSRGEMEDIDDEDVKPPVNHKVKIILPPDVTTHKTIALKEIISISGNNQFEVELNGITRIYNCAGTFEDAVAWAIGINGVTITKEVFGDNQPLNKVEAIIHNA